MGESGVGQTHSMTTDNAYNVVSAIPKIIKRRLKRV